MASNPAESYSMKKNNFERNVVKQESCSNSESGFNTTPENNVKHSVINLEPEKEFDEYDPSNVGYEHPVLNTDHQELHKNTQGVQDPSVKTEPQDGSDTEMLDSEDDQGLPVKSEADNPDAAGHGVDCNLSPGSGKFFWVLPIGAWRCYFRNRLLNRDLDLKI